MLNVVMLNVVVPSIHLFFPLPISPVYPSVPSFVYISCLSICSLLCLSLLSIHLFFPLFICPVYESVLSFVYLLLSIHPFIPLSICDSVYPPFAPKVAGWFVQQTGLNLKTFFIRRRQQVKMFRLLPAPGIYFLEFSTRLSTLSAPLGFLA
jgi:hypothetical protein